MKHASKNGTRKSEAYRALRRQVIEQRRDAISIVLTAERILESLGEPVPSAIVPKDKRLIAPVDNSA